MRRSVREVPTPKGLGRAHVVRPVRARGTVVLSHGAGGGLGALDLALARDAAVAAGWAFVLVEQPWLVAGRRIAGPPPTLDAAWLPIVGSLLSGRARLPRPLVVGGRSAGARVACRTAAQLEADAALLLSFPLHPPGRPDRLRDHELVLSPPPSWVVQGLADPFGTPDEVRALTAPGTTVFEVPGAHSFTGRSRDALATTFATIMGMLPG